MKILVSGATRTLKRFVGHPNLGQLLTPQDGNAIVEGLPYAADNAAYSNWDETKFLRLLDRLQGLSPLWVASPDVVGNAIATDELLDRWHPKIKKRGLPVALVIQNGQEAIGLPAAWKFDAVFIGGDDAFKLGRYTRFIVEKMKAKGKWVHMGRVNSLKRIQYAYEIGCDSVDGTACSMFSETYIPKFLRHLEQPQNGLDGVITTAVYKPRVVLEKPEKANNYDRLLQQELDFALASSPDRGETRSGSMRSTIERRL